MRVVKCSQEGCQQPATWTHGTWYACDKHIRQLLLVPDMFEKETGYTLYGTAGRLKTNEVTEEGMDENWLATFTVEVNDDEN